MHNFHNLIQHEMREVDNIILSHLHSKENLIEIVSKYLINSGGKRIRPTLSIIASKACGYNGNANIKLAAAIEFIHAATLLHDDVVDNSKMRRFKDSANIIWGNKTSILVGDFLFSKSFNLMVDSGSMNAIKRLSKASTIIAEGEVLQLIRTNEKRMITLEEYYEIIGAKTAELFSASCEVGSIISTDNKESNDILSKFGFQLGKIFQISDDALDYFSTEDKIGKNIGDDFAEGKITLPIILAYEICSKDDKSFFDEVLFKDIREKNDFIKTLSILEKHNIKEQINEINHKIFNNTLQLLENFEGDYIYKEGLKSILLSSSII